MIFTQQIDNNTLEVRLSGQLDRANHDELYIFFDYIQDLKVHTVRFNFSQLERIDSASLGYLILARQELLSRGIAAQLTNIKGQVWKSLNLMMFDKLFDIV